MNEPSYTPEMLAEVLPEVESKVGDEVPSVQVARTGEVWTVGLAPMI